MAPSQRQFEVPERTSSKRRRADSDLKNGQAQLELLEREIKSSKGKLRPKGSFDAEYWKQRTIISEKVLSQHEVRKRVSSLEFQLKGKGSEEDWKNSEEGESLSIKEKALQLIAKQCNDQQARVSIGKGGKSSSLGRAFVQLFTTSRRALNVDTSSGARNKSVQYNFRKALESVTATDADGLAFKCPITKLWWDKPFMKAAHLFPHKTGQDIMVALFGSDAEGELFAPCNGILMVATAEELLDKGLLLIVPDLPHDAGLAQFQLWHSLDVKEYKILIPDKENTLIKRPFNRGSSPEQSWATLHNTKVEFHGLWRPRARYLYYTYMTAMLRQSWRPNLAGEGQYVENLKGELGKPYWGTIAKYLHESQIASMVTEMGHTFDGLLDAYDLQQGQPNQREEDPIALAAASSHIAGRTNVGEEGVEGEDSSGGESEDY
ncbi:MAG: hypothetical protein Q9207_002722 [Kuettlingeria erythrocarpa]